MHDSYTNTNNAMQDIFDINYKQLHLDTYFDNNKDYAEKLNANLAYTSLFWKDFYKKNQLCTQASPFATWCMKQFFYSGDRVLEFGCGNGRDSFYFLQHGLSVIAIDGCQEAILRNISSHSNETFTGACKFINENFLNIENYFLTNKEVFTNMNKIYSRFVLHAIPEEVENIILSFCFNILPKGGRMFHEFRTTQDPLMQKGKVLSDNERFTDHYRRFIATDTFRQKVAESGWKEIFFIENSGLAVFKNDDPVVARIILEKQ